MFVFLLRVETLQLASLFPVRMSISENGRTRELSTAALSGSQPYALISLTTLCADSIAPCITHSIGTYAHPQRKSGPPCALSVSLRSLCRQDYKNRRGHL